MLKINPGHPKVWLSRDHIQFGLEAEAVTVGGLSPAHQRLLRLLEVGISENQLPIITNSLKLEPASASLLLQQLQPVLLSNENTLPSSHSDSRRFPFAQPHPDFAEIIRFGLRHNVSGEIGIQRRSARIVHIDDLARVGLTTIRGLASAGVTQFWCSDSNSVQESDTTALGYPKELLGWTRFMAADTLAKSFQNPVALVESSQLRARVLDRIDFAIVVAGQVVDPKVAGRWWRRGIPHLAITFDSSGTRVSPVVFPGKTPCLVCRENQIASQDERHLVRLNQLLASKTAYDDSSSVLFAASAATASALAQLDFEASFSTMEHERQGTWFERKSGLVHRLTWPDGSACRCHDSETEGAANQTTETASVKPAA